MSIFNRRNYLVNNNLVTHRQWGEIPFCVPAVDEFTELSSEEAQAFVLEKAEQHSKAIHAYIAGEYGGQTGLQEMWRDASKFTRKPPIWIKNPSVPYKNKYAE